MTEICPETLFDDAPTDTGNDRGLRVRERRLIGLATSLGAADAHGIPEAEQRLVEQGIEPSSIEREQTRRRIKAGDDPLGEVFTEIFSPSERRGRGATYTPSPVIDAMLGWITDEVRAPVRIVDPGAGTGRFLLAAARRYKHAVLVAVETDPLPALLTRANLAVAGLTRRSEVFVTDYREQVLAPIDGQTLFIGNPPYVRHHEIDTVWKQWLTREATARTLSVSQLAGLHAHFYLATLLKAKEGDFGTFVTAAEWLDVNYGRLIRDLFVGPLGGKALVLIEPTARPFPDAATTAVVSQFMIGSRSKSIQIGRVADVPTNATKRPGRPVRRERFEAERRWSHLTRRSRKEPGDYVELGEFCRVHRGTVTGANKFWIEGEHSLGLPAEVYFPSVTRARDLFAAGEELTNIDRLRRVVDLPPELDGFDAEQRKVIDRFLDRAKRLGVDKGYIAASRKNWYSVGLRDPAPILATYMARRPPAFVRNGAEARHINIAHGIYPREKMSEDALARLAAHLSTTVKLTEGRTYAGGLTKFEPREMERLLIPPPARLTETVA